MDRESQESSDNCVFEVALGSEEGLSAVLLSAAVVVWLPSLIAGMPVRWAKYGLREALHEHANKAANAHTAHRTLL